MGDGQLDSDKYNTMMRLTGRFALPLVACFMLVIVFIHARPYDDSEVLAFLSPPEGCPAPCFMNIRPGVTTVGAAIAALENSVWVEEVFITAYGQMQPSRVTWKWSNSAPPLAHRTDFRRGGTLGVDDGGIVEYISFSTNIMLGQVLISWGKPEKYTTIAQTGGPVGGPRPPKPITVIYQDRIVIGGADCPYSRHLWTSESSIILGKPEAWLQGVIPRPFVAATTPLTQYVRELTRENCPR
jgi:hypothetical protein